MSEAFNEKLDAKEKELEKIKKEKSKSEKDHNIVLKEIKEELSRCYDEVKRATELNTKLEEEKKTLLGIHKVNIDLRKN